MPQFSRHTIFQAECLAQNLVVLVATRKPTVGIVRRYAAAVSGEVSRNAAVASAQLYFLPSTL
jgi:hypothetical protein